MRTRIEPWVAALVCPLTGILLVSCASVPRNYFPNFDPKAFGAKPTVLVIDLLWVDDVRGDRHLVNLITNQQAIGLIYSEAVEILEANGFNISQAFVTSIGILFPNAGFLTTDQGTGENGNSAWGDSQLGSLRLAPFVTDYNRLPDVSVYDLLLLHSQLANTALRHLAGVNSSLINWRLTGFPKNVNYAVIQCSVFNVNSNKSMAKAIGSAILTLGLVALMENSNTRCGAYLLTADDGQVVWASRGRKAMAPRSTSSAGRIIEALLSRLPSVNYAAP